MSIINTNYRYERKFDCKNISLQYIKLIIKNNPLLFNEIYQPRWINNIYFDTLGLSNYYDSIMGINKRIKVRIRWYGEFFSVNYKPVLEFKNKVGFIGKKNLFKIQPFVMDTQNSINQLNELLQISELPDKIKYFVKELSPVLCIRYKRRYYRSANRKFRITIDNELSYSGYNSISYLSFKKFSNDSHKILELKYKYSFQDAAPKITNYLPFRMTKFSKYAMCLKKSFNH